MASITISGIEKSFGDARVLERIDLDVAHGEFLTLVGPSGCGKSTLLRIIAGLEGASAGQVHIGDRRVDGVRAADRNLAMVFQSYALYPHLTVAENMLTPLKLPADGVGMGGDGAAGGDWAEAARLGRFLSRQAYFEPS